MRVAVLTLSITMLLTLPVRLQAQGKDEVPPEFRPPAGMCRIWIEGVPPGRQPAPTDCSTAIRRRPPNARVIFGDQSVAPPARSYREEPKESERPPRRSELDDRKEEPKPERPPPRPEPRRRDPPEGEPAREAPRFQRNDPAG